MLKSYFKVAFRSFLKDKKYSIINLSGLIIGLASVFIILAYVKYELSYDKYYSNSSRIYRITETAWYNDHFRHDAYAAQGIGNVLVHDIPGVEAATDFLPYSGEFLINHQPVKLTTIAVSGNFFSIFNLPLKYGHPASVLSYQNDIVVSENFVKRYFSHQTVIGKQIFTQNDDKSKSIYTITGIMQNIPGNTHFTADIIMALKSSKDSFNLNEGYGQYILLSKNTAISEVKKSIPAIYKKYGFPSSTTINFQQATSIHLHSNIEGEYFANSSIVYVYVFLFVAAFTLVIACINYINLNTARSLQRLKEIGVRKIMGARRKELSIQFIAESVLFFAVSIPFAIAVAYLLWPMFAHIVNINIPASYLLGPGALVILVAATAVTGVLAGSYAAFFVSRLRPVHILKDWQKSSAVNMRVRKSLIVFQFAISVAFIIATTIANQQLYLLNNMDLGFNRNQLIILPSESFGNSSQSFKSILLKNPNITSVSINSWNLGKWYSGFTATDMPGDSTPVWQMNVLHVDADFSNTMQMKVIEGRPFGRVYPMDLVNFDSLADGMENKKPLTLEQRQNILSARPIIVSAPVAKMIHLQEPVVGTVLNKPYLAGTVVGEIKDFIGVSLLQKQPAVILTLDPDPEFGYTYIRLSPQNMQETIGYIRKTWQKFFPGHVFDFSFADDKLNEQYDTQTRMASVFDTFAALAIVIALLGLVSLVALTVQQKTKEIGIRKVLGAGIADIIGLLSKGYITLIFIASLIAIPVTWWAMNRWLQDFDYRISIHLTTFIIVTAACLLTALLSIVAQTIKVARANPVNSLRAE
ncbi:MAG TPA: FtsX-like permease family protein [Chitinophagaceae bacterium]|nr:FtsX-like permease family protein [Chitinophagaceae bacterium]